TVLPVVDEEGRLVGIVTVDDVLDVLEEEATEDIHRLAAVDVPDLVYSQAPPLALWLARVRWLVILILTGMVTSSILQGFESLLEAVTALAFYVPVLIGTGGNTGNQSATLIIRALATRDLDLRDWRRVLAKEAAVGVLLGLTLALFLLGKVVLDGQWALVPVVGLSLLLIVLFANLVGALLPFALRRLGVDPALLSNPLIATLTDVTGLLIYLTLARLLLGLA
ncbi:MAG: magnesium transporter, partial [Desulfurococcaceae archaeon]